MEKERRQMVEKIMEYGLSSPEVLGVLQMVPRHEFLPKKYRKIAYDDAPVPIGFGQTMSQPYTVAVMSRLSTEFLIPNFEFRNKSQFANTKFQVSEPKNKIFNTKYLIHNTRVLEIGTGSGYQAAVLSYFFDEVYTLEIIPQLAEKSKKTLFDLGFKNIDLRVGNGSLGWREKSPFDAIMITAGVEKVPKRLFRQLKVGGVLVAPVGKADAKIMTRFTKLKKRGKEEIKVEKFGKFSFVPFVEV